MKKYFRKFFFILCLIYLLYEIISGGISTLFELFTLGCLFYLVNWLYEK